MPFETDWYLKNRVILTRITGEMDTNEIRALNDRAVGMIDNAELSDSATPLVHHLINIEEMTGFPRKINEVSNSVTFASPQMGWLIIVGKVNPIIRFFGGVITQVSKIRFRVIETMPEALEFLQEVDPSLKGRLVEPAPVSPDAGN